MSHGHDGADVHGDLTQYLGTDPSKGCSFPVCTDCGDTGYETEDVLTEMIESATTNTALPLKNTSGVAAVGTAEMLLLPRGSVSERKLKIKLLEIQLILTGMLRR